MEEVELRLRRRAGKVKPRWHIVTADEEVEQHNWSHRSSASPYNCYLVIWSWFTPPVFPKNSVLPCSFHPQNLTEGNNTAASKQKTGLSSAMLADVRGVTDGRVSDLRAIIRKNKDEENR